MNVGVKLAGFAAVTATVFGLAFGVGSVLDPIASEDEVGLAVTEAPHAAAAVAAAGLPGLEVSSRGYTLVLEDMTPAAGEAVEVAFTITSPDGGPVLNFDTTHEKQMHLIVVGRDLSNFQHLHPERDADGTWRVPVDLSAAGAYRFFADFAPSVLGETITLGADVLVPGRYTPAELPGAATEWSADGYEVTLSGTPGAGGQADLAFTVTRNGMELTDLEPYLGAFGHLVSLRSGDLAYLHTHPADEALGGQRGGPEIRFATTFPTAGRYRLFLNFAHDGEVRTAEFTVSVPAGSGTPVVAPSAPASDNHDGH